MSIQLPPLSYSMSRRLIIDCLGSIIQIGKGILVIAPPLLLMLVILVLFLFHNLHRNKTQFLYFYKGRISGSCFLLFPSLIGSTIYFGSNSFLWLIFQELIVTVLESFIFVSIPVFTESYHVCGHLLPLCPRSGWAQAA